MTEQEYCDLSDLQICRAIITMTSTLNSLDGQNKDRLRIIRQNLHLITSDLEPKISKAME